MTSLDTGYYGAKVASWDASSARAFFKKLADENHEMDKEALFKRVLAEALDPDNADILQTIIKYWYVNAYNWWEADRTAPKSRTEKAKAAKAREKKAEAIKAIIKVRAQQMVLMDLVMPSGKTLRDATGKDCVKAGGFFAKIGAKLKPSQVVGRSMSEADLRKLWK